MTELIEKSRGEQEAEINYEALVVKFNHGEYKLTADGLSCVN